MSKQLICETHDEIKKCVEKALRKLNYAVKSLGKSDCEHAKDALSEVEDAVFDVNYILGLVDTATQSGQSMENRLTEYRKTIEKLGFTRKSKEE